MLLAIAETAIITATAIACPPYSLGMARAAVWHLILPTHRDRRRGLFRGAICAFLKMAEVYAVFAQGALGRGEELICNSLYGFIVGSFGKSLPLSLYIPLAFRQGEKRMMIAC